MYAAFEGEIQDGRIIIAELAGRTKILEGKHLLITPLDLDAKREAIGGTVLAGIYKNGDLVDASGRTHKLNDFDKRSVFVVIRHALMANVTGEVFDQKYQLGAKLGDLDD